MKILLIRNCKPSTWLSCQTISSNLQHLYSTLEAQQDVQITWFNIAADSFTDKLTEKSLMIFDLMNLIKSKKPDKIVFIDHLPGPYQVLKSLSLLLDQNEIPPVIIHVYGDFTYFAKDWMSLNDFIMGHNISFVAASDAQVRLVNCFLESQTSQSIVQKLCFPVDVDQFCWKKSTRQQTRKKFNVGEEDFIILYSGRVSMQKNVDLLIKEFGQICVSRPLLKCQLWIAGEFDDLGAAVLGLESISGSMFTLIQDSIQKLPSQVRNKIKLLGHFHSTDLESVLHAADLFVSLSLHHDEDFGMAPAEALATGLCSTLTRWGGYSSFYSPEKEWECSMIPVDIAEDGLFIETSELSSYLDYVSSNRLRLERERGERSRKFLEKFGIEPNVQTLYKILTASDLKKFAGFNNLLRAYGSKFLSMKKERVVSGDMIPQNNNFYHQIYKNYL